jgi:hypothetical protein
MSAPSKRGYIGNAKAQMSILAMNLRLYRFNFRLHKFEILGALAFIGVCLFALSLAGSGLLRKTNWGFGPDWDCSATGTQAALVCIKTLPRNSH